MADIRIRNLDPELVAALRERAAIRGRSLEAHVTDILVDAIEDPRVKGALLLNRIRAVFAGRTFSDSAELVAEDRRR